MSGYAIHDGLGEMEELLDILEPLTEAMPENTSDQVQFVNKC